MGMCFNPQSCFRRDLLSLVAEAKSKRESELGMLRSEKAELKQKVEQQRATIQRFQQDEQQRLSQLKAALNTYFSSTPKLSETDIM